MASKRALVSLPGVARAFSASAPLTPRSRQSRPRPSLLCIGPSPKAHLQAPSTPFLARFAHVIPRPRPAGAIRSSSSQSPSSSPSPASSSSPSPSPSSPSSSSSPPTAAAPAAQQQQQQQQQQQAEEEEEEEKRGSKGSQAATDRSHASPHYELTFTCVPCGRRSRHRVSKQGYHGGSVLITCPQCRNRHVIADHLRIFGDRAVTVEDLLREKGRLVRRGALGEDGDIEFWDDGAVTPRGERGGGEDVIEPGDRPVAAQADEGGQRRGEEMGTAEDAAPPGSSFK